MIFASAYEGIKFMFTKEEEINIVGVDRQAGVGWVVCVFIDAVRYGPKNSSKP